MLVVKVAGVSSADGQSLPPYHPTSYRPYFLGEFGFRKVPDNPGSTKIDLLNPQEPLLYWLVPILPRPEAPARGDKDRKDYVDYLSQHAGHDFPWDQLR